ncbi:WD40-repeat-containing domain protein [Phycomyces nitens]|nr:WD40-repeat-containing domain protein [Phycomyces nitens]
MTRSHSPFQLSDFFSKGSQQPTAFPGSSSPTCLAIVLQRNGTLATKQITSSRKRSKHTTHNAFRRIFQKAQPIQALKKTQRLCTLPTEILVSILTFLDLPALLSLSSTCHLWHRLCSPANYVVWNGLVKADYPISLQLGDPYAVYRENYALRKRWTAGEAQVSHLTGHQDNVYCMAWISKEQFVSGSRDRSLKMWDISSGQTTAIKTQSVHQGSILCLGVSQDKSILVTGSSDATCIVWSLPEMTSRPLVFRNHQAGILDLCVALNYCVSSSRDNTVRVWDYSTAKECHTLVGHTGPVNALDAEGPWVVSASGDTTLKLWDVRTGACLRTFTGHAMGLTCIKIQAGMIYSGGQDGRVKIWQQNTGICTMTLVGHTKLIRAVTENFGWIFSVLMNRTQMISAGQSKEIMALDFGLNSLSNTAS